jgi:DNA-binding transcriptional MerR regulator
MKQNLDSLLPASEEGLYPIRTVSEVTGVNAITLRAWERRYGLFKPKRTPKGHRLYSQQDILRIQQVLQLLEKGVAIGRVVNALKNEAELEDLADLTMRSDSIEHPPVSGNKETPSEDQWKTYHEKLMSHVNAYDIAQLERLHHEIFSLYPLEIVSRSLIRPSINELRSQADQLQSLSGNYHFYWHFLQQRLGGIFLKSTLQNRGKKILLMGYGDHKADIELMLFGLPLLTHGYQVVLLGCDISFDSIPMTLSRANSDGLVLYTTSNESADSKLNLEIVMSIKAVADSLNMPVFLTDENIEQQKNELADQGLVILPGNALEQLKVMDQHLSKKDI